jgi:hypothetical protein
VTNDQIWYYYLDCILKILFIYEYIKIFFYINTLKKLKNTKKMNLIFFLNKYIFKTYKIQAAASNN